jgi:ABC-type transport system involved in cytochrome c biogenesis permease subunit
MATRARVVPLEERSAPGGNVLLILVGLSVAFLLIVALLGAAKSSAGLISESNFLYVALIFYAGAGALYMGFGVTGVERYVKFASIATLIGLVANTGAIAHRWYLSGRPPFASIYEMLLSFVWTVGLLTLVAEKKFGVKIIGSITMPLAVVCVILMQLLPSEVRPLVPALQSTWLHVHVTLAMLAYASCAVSAALAMMFLIQDHFGTESFLAWTSAIVGAIYVAIVVTRFDKGGLSVTAWDASTKSDMFLGRGMRLFCTSLAGGSTMTRSSISPTVLCSSAFCCRWLCWQLSRFVCATPVTRHPTRMDSSRPAWPPAPSSLEAW